MLTDAQKATVQADIAGDGTLNSYPNTPDGNYAIAEIYNQQASPDYYVWRTSMPISEIKETVDWYEVVTMTTAELLAFQVLTAQDVVNPSDESLRNAFTEIFNGAGGVNSRTALQAAAYRLATRIEKLLCTGGDGTTTTPSTLTFEGIITYQDIEDARNY